MDQKLSKLKPKSSLTRDAHDFAACSGQTERAAQKLKQVHQLEEKLDKLFSD